MNTLLSRLRLTSQHLFNSKVHFNNYRSFSFIVNHGHTPSFYIHARYNHTNNNNNHPGLDNPTSQTHTNETSNEGQLQVEEKVREMKPSEVVAELNRYIIGQDEAKRAVANALRNRWRRKQIEGPIRDEIVPRNILMIGPTGVGKTEIARRLAKLTLSPFIKVEATKFTEVGYHGPDVDQIIRDLAESAVQETKRRLRQKNRSKIEEAVEDKLLQLLVGDDGRTSTRDHYLNSLRAGEYENREIEIPDNMLIPSGLGMTGGTVEEILRNFSNYQRSLPKKRKFVLSRLRSILLDQEAERLLNPDLIAKEAINRVEQDGIVFIDEIDKICVSSNVIHHRGPDASSVGVQRDLLPLIEGTIINTKYGNVDTSKILFIASGAFHSCKPSDLIAELQGRLPVRVELRGLTQADLYRILTEPELNPIRQQQYLMSTENVNLVFQPEALREIARITAEVNRNVENIGARRLHTVIERLMEDISFFPSTSSEKLAKLNVKIQPASDRPEEGSLTTPPSDTKQKGNPIEIVIDFKLVQERLAEFLVKTDLSKFII